jgi:hypothetical protein
VIKIPVDHTIIHKTMFTIEDLSTVDYRHVKPVAGPILKQDYC